ncbi:hypothetical protein CerSpe_026920 [Prunus speciosa]
MSSLQPQQQQPALVYPNNVRGQPSSSHHSNGSFGTVFIVLAVIVVISAIACFLGRLCNRRLHNSKPNKQPAQNFRPSKKETAMDNHHMEFGNNNNPSFRAPKDTDIEFGFDKKIPNGNGNGNGSRSESRGYMNNHSKPHHGNGDHHIHMKGEMKQSGDHVVIREPRASG